MREFTGKPPWGRREVSGVEMEAEASRRLRDVRLGEEVGQEQKTAGCKALSSGPATRAAAGRKPAGREAERPGRGGEAGPGLPARTGPGADVESGMPKVGLLAGGKSHWGFPSDRTPWLGERR